MKTSNKSKKLILDKMTIAILRSPHTIRGGNGEDKNKTKTARTTTVTITDTES